MRRLIYFALFIALTASVLAQSADLSLLKNAAPNPVAPGGSLTYSITLSNEGPDTAANVTLSDTLPAGTTFQSLTPEAGWSCSTGPTVTCSLASFAPGTANFTLVVTVDPSAANGTVISNSVTVASTTNDPNMNDNTSTVDVTVSAPVAALAITKADSPDPVMPGSTLTYTITASNNGGTPLDTATVSDPLPSGTTFVSLTPPAGWSCSMPAVGAGGSVSCSISPLPDATNAVFTLVVNVPMSLAHTIVTNTATYFSSVGGRDTTLTATATTTVLDPTTTSINAPTITYGANGIVTVTVNGTATAPTGNVSLIVDGGAPLSQALSPASATSSTATFTLTLPNAGSHTLQANYAAQGSFTASSGSGTLLVNPAPTTTSINAPAVNYNANGVVTVTVSSASAAPTGNVSLTVDGGAPLSQALSPVNATSSSATFTLISPAVGPHTLAASYGAQPNFLASNASGTLTVNPAPTTTTIVVTPSIAVIGSNVTFTATVTSGVGTPTGNVQFLVDGSPFGAPVALSSGTAALTTSSLVLGSHSVSAMYAANGNFAGSTSATAPVTIVETLPALDAKVLVVLALMLAAVAMLRSR